MARKIYRDRVSDVGILGEPPRYADLLNQPITLSNIERAAWLTWQPNSRYLYLNSADLVISAGVKLKRVPRTWLRIEGILPERRTPLGIPRTRRDMDLWKLWLVKVIVPWCNREGAIIANQDNEAWPSSEQMLRWYARHQGTTVRTLPLSDKFDAPRAQTSDARLEQRLALVGSRFKRAIGALQSNRDRIVANQIIWMRLLAPDMSDEAIAAEIRKRAATAKAEYAEARKVAPRGENAFQYARYLHADDVSEIYDRVMVVVEKTMWMHGILSLWWRT